MLFLCFVKYYVINKECIYLYQKKSMIIFYQLLSFVVKQIFNYGHKVFNRNSKIKLVA
jgi:hypothetical protein